MKSSQICYRVLSYMKPYWLIFALSLVTALIVVITQGISTWLLGTLPMVLFSTGEQIIARPEILSFGTLNEWLKYWTSAFIQSNTFANPLILVSIVLMIAFTAKNIFLYINHISTGMLNFSVARDMRNHLYSHILRLSAPFYDRNRSGNLISLMVNDLNLLNTVASETLSSLIMEPLRLMGFITMLFLINTKLTLALFIVYPILIFIISKIGQSVRRRSRRNLDSYDEMVSTLTETVNGVRAVKMFNMAEEEDKKFHHVSSVLRRNQYKQRVVGDILSPLTETMAFYLIAGLLLLGSTQMSFLSTGSFTAEDFTRFLVFLFSSYQPLKQLGLINNKLQAAFAAAQRVFTVLDTKPEPLTPLDTSKIPPFTTSIAFENLSFAYEGTDKNVINDISLHVRKGEMIALVGSSGAGKSTILDLLPRFYEVTTGKITLDGTPVSTFDLAAYRELFGIVAQETILFNATIEKNIAYGSPNASFEEVYVATKAANALEFVEELPEGFQTVIGERGVTLSGGQRQRLAIARAILRNPEILILDEATSALDTESETLVQEALSRLMEGRTTFVVAHRLSTIRSADRIVVLEAGKIVEIGTHTELLLHEEGRYKQLHDMQFGAKDKRLIAERRINRSAV